MFTLFVSPLCPVPIPSRFLSLENLFFQTNSNPASGSHWSDLYYYILKVLSVLKLHVKGIYSMQSLCLALFTWHDIYEIHQYCCKYQKFISLLSNSPLCEHASLAYSLVKGHFCLYLVFGIMNEVAVNICMLVFTGHVFISLGWIPKWYCVKCLFNFIYETVKLFPK